MNKAGKLWSKASLERVAALFEREWAALAPENSNLEGSYHGSVEGQASGKGQANGAVRRIYAPNDAIAALGEKLIARMSSEMDEAICKTLPTEADIGSHAQAWRSFVESTVQAFTSLDLLHATRQLLHNAKGSFGLVTSHSLDCQEAVVIAARGQTMSIACYPQQGLCLWGSEVGATKVAMDSGINSSHLSEGSDKSASKSASGWLARATSSCSIRSSAAKGAVDISVHGDSSLHGAASFKTKQRRGSAAGRALGMMIGNQTPHFVGRQEAKGSSVGRGSVAVPKLRTMDVPAGGTRSSARRPMPKSQRTIDPKFDDFYHLKRNGQRNSFRLDLDDVPTLGSTHKAHLLLSPLFTTDFPRQWIGAHCGQVNGEVCELRWGKAGVVPHSSDLPDGVQLLELMRYGRGNALVCCSYIGGHLKADSLVRRLLPLDGNPLLPVYSSLEVDDQVARDIADIPKVLSLLQAQWEHPNDAAESYNRLTALTFTSLLTKRMHLHDRRQHDGSVDLLITGCEVSLWMGEQFAADLHRAFPKLNVVTISANKLLAQLGQSFPIPQLNFQFHERSYSLSGALVLVISHSGGTFAPLACSNLLRAFTSHIFTVTSEWDTQVAAAIRKARATVRKAQGIDKADMVSYVFTTMVGVRPAEPCTVSVAATHHLLSLLLIHIMHTTRSVASISGAHSLARAAGSTFTMEEVEELNELNRSGLEAIRDIVGEQVDDPQEGKAPKLRETATSAKLRAQGRLWSQHILEGPISWIMSAVYIALTVITGTTPISIIFFLFREHVLEQSQTNASLACAPGGVPILDRVDGAPTSYWVAIEYLVGTLDAVIYMFLPWWTTVLLRLCQGRHWLHRVAGRSILIGDVPWVAQSIEAYVSKLFALSYSIATCTVFSGNPTDHLVRVPSLTSSLMFSECWTLSQRIQR